MAIQKSYCLKKWEVTCDVAGCKSHIPDLEGQFSGIQAAKAQGWWVVENAAGTKIFTCPECLKEGK